MSQGSGTYLFQRSSHPAPRCEDFSTPIKARASSAYLLGLTTADYSTFLPTMALLMLAELLVLLIVLVISIYYVFLVPPRHPQNIPAIPFWVTLLPFVQDVDQSETFRRYIEKPLREYGAVKIFFGAQWNVLVHRPAYLSEMFRQEDVYQKSGNQKKIPHSVLAAFLGDNIISAHGENWKLYQGVVKPGLQKSFDAAPLAQNARLLVELIRKAKERAGLAGIPVQELMQRYTIANTTRVLLQVNVPVRGPTHPAFCPWQMYPNHKSDHHPRRSPRRTCTSTRCRARSSARSSSPSS
jgi:cytochrome P450